METISQLRAWFTALKKPTQAQFWAVFDSFAHKSRDFDQMGGGLKPHSPDRPYTAGEAMIKNGRIRTAKYNLAAGVYNASQWEDFSGDPASLGLLPYDPNEEVIYDAEAPIQRTHRLAILEAIDDSQGIEPFVDPDWESVWLVVIFTDGGLIPILPDGGFVKKDRVYSYRGSDAPKGLYRCMRSDIGLDGGFKTTDFVAELGDGESGDWRLEAAASADVAGPTKIIGLISQAGTNPPTLEIFEDTTALTYTFAYLGVGGYRLTLETPEAGSRLWAIFGAPSFKDGGSAEVPNYYYTSGYTIFIDAPGGDGSLVGCPFEIRIYPPVEEEE